MDAVKDLDKPALEARLGPSDLDGLEVLEAWLITCGTGALAPFLWAQAGFARRAGTTVRHIANARGARRGGNPLPAMRRQAR
jgi:hypothetical protein